MHGVNTYLATDNNNNSSYCQGLENMRKTAPRKGTNEQEESSYYENKMVNPNTKT